MSTEELLDRITSTKRQLADLQTTYDRLLDELTDAYQSGEVDPGFTHNDWSLTFSEGRRTWSYPPAVKQAEAQLKAAKRLAEADGTAEAKIGAPFWTVRPPAAA